MTEELGLHEDDLKRCPFCGGECWTTMCDISSRLWVVGCGDCHTYNKDESGGFNSRQDAVKAWNKRVKEW